MANALPLCSDGERVSQKASAAIRGEAGLRADSQERAGAAGKRQQVVCTTKSPSGRDGAGCHRHYSKCRPHLGREKKAINHFASHLGCHYKCWSPWGVKARFSACRCSTLGKDALWCEEHEHKLGVSESHFHFCFDLAGISLRFGSQISYL